MAQNVLKGCRRALRLILTSISAIELQKVLEHCLPADQEEEKIIEDGSKIESVYDLLADMMEDEEKKEGIENGHGIYQYTNGLVYEGMWKDFQRHGQGKLTYPSGNSWEGPWEED